MLAQLSLMTANSAREVVKAYPTVQSLLNAIVSKQERLADIVVSIAIVLIQVRNAVLTSNIRSAAILRQILVNWVLRWPSALSK